MIPPVLQDVAQAITNHMVQLPSGSGDARRDSSAAESNIVGWLHNYNQQKQKGWKITSPNVGSKHNRSWYDLKINGLYCDIKVSELRGNDNTNAKKAVYYLLTGDDPEKVSNHQDKFFKSMRDNEKAGDKRDFYYIVVSKPAADAFVVSLKGIAKVTPAPNNMPFQCKWDNCRIPTTRTWQEAKHYLLEQWATAIKSGMATLKNGMPEYYPDFFGDSS